MQLPTVIHLQPYDINIVYDKCTCGNYSGQSSGYLLDQILNMLNNKNILKKGDWVQGYLLSGQFIEC